MKFSAISMRNMSARQGYPKKQRSPSGLNGERLQLVWFSMRCGNPFFFHNNSATTPGIADAAPMIYVNDTLYKQSTSQTSFNELKDNFVYLGVIESDVTNFQGTNDAGNYLDGIPKENFQANHPIVGSEVYQYGENIVVGIGGKYWLYENYHSTDLDGNPDGYGPLPNNQTSAEEVSEQDPAAN